jgi:hypothetical protein
VLKKKTPILESVDANNILPIQPNIDDNGISKIQALFRGVKFRSKELPDIISQDLVNKKQQELQMQQQQLKLQMQIDRDRKIEQATNAYFDIFHEDQVGANLIRSIRLNKELFCGYIRSDSVPIFDAIGSSPTISHILMRQLVQFKDRTGRPSTH